MNHLPLPKALDLQTAEPLSSEVGLAGLIEQRLTRYVHADRQILPSHLYERVLHEVERPLLRVVLGLTEGNKIKAAQILGLNRNTLLKKLRQHGLVDESAARNKKSRRRVTQ